MFALWQNKYFSNKLNIILLYNNTNLKHQLFIVNTYIIHYDNLIDVSQVLYLMCNKNTGLGFEEVYGNARHLSTSEHYISLDITFDTFFK